MTLPPLRDYLADTTWLGCAVAHRGAWHRTAENSLQSIEEAIDLGCQFVELDVQESYDGVYFCLHDLSLKRTAQLNLHAGAHVWSRFAHTPLALGEGGETAEWTDQCLPRFEEALACAKGRIYIDIDAKRPHHLRGIARLVHDLGCADFVNIKAWVRGRSDLELAEQLAQELGLILKPIVYAEQGNLDLVQEIAARLDAPMVEAVFDSWHTLAQCTDALRTAGRDVFVNTLDEAASSTATDSQGLTHPDDVWGALMRAGVRLMQTDEPEALMRYLRSGAVDAHHSQRRPA